MAGRNDKAIVLALNAIADGCETSNAVAAVMNIPVASASAHLSELASIGLVRRAETDSIRFTKRGRASHRYVLAGK